MTILNTQSTKIVDEVATLKSKGKAGPQDGLHTRGSLPPPRPSARPLLGWQMRNWALKVGLGKSLRCPELPPILTL